MDEIPESWPTMRKAIEFNRRGFADLPKLFGCNLAGLKELDWVELAIALHPRIETLVPDERRVYHKVPDDVALFLAGAAQTHRDAYDMLVAIAQRNIVNSAPIPVDFQHVVFKILEGDFPVPTKRGARPSPEFAQKWVLRESALFTRDLFDLPLSRNEAKCDDESACDAVVIGAEQLGFAVKYNAVRDYCIHKDYAGFRERADHLTNFVKNLFLLQTGVIKDWRKGHLFL